jgi:hypothetical protein
MPDASNEPLAPRTARTADDAPALGLSARYRRLGRRIVIVAFVLFVTAFVAVSAFEIIVPAVRGPGALSGGRAVLANGPCAEALDELTRAVDVAAARALTARAGGEALEVFEQALRPSWDRAPEVVAMCEGEPRGSDAYAAVLRLRRAQEVFVQRQVAEIAPLRRDVSAYLPP